MSISGSLAGEERCEWKPVLYTSGVISILSYVLHSLMKYSMESRSPVLGTE